MKEFPVCECCETQATSRQVPVTLKLLATLPLVPGRLVGIFYFNQSSSLWQWQPTTLPDPSGIILTLFTVISVQGNPFPNKQ